MTTWRWIDTFTRQLELCAVIPDEEIVLLSRASTDPDLLETLVIAVNRLEANATRLVADDGAEPSAVLRAAVGAAHLTIDCAGIAETWDPGSDARLLVIGAKSPAELARLAPHPGLARRVGIAARIIGAGSDLLLTTPAGTSVAIELQHAETTTNPAATTGAGTVAHWPGGSVTVVPAADTVAGTVVLMPGDRLTTFGRTCRSPVRMEIEDDRIVEIIGESTDADLVRSHLEGFGALDAYGVAGLTLGLQPQPGDQDAWTPLSAADSHLRGGVVSITTGSSKQDDPANPAGAGGIDISLRGATLTINGVELVSRGALDGGLAPDVYEQAGRSDH